jgi:hypothetical protein
MTTVNDYGHNYKRMSYLLQSVIGRILSNTKIMLKGSEGFKNEQICVILAAIKGF